MRNLDLENADLDMNEIKNCIKDLKLAIQKKRILLSQLEDSFDLNEDLIHSVESIISSINQHELKFYNIEELKSVLNCSIIINDILNDHTNTVHLSALDHEIELIRSQPEQFPHLINSSNCFVKFACSIISATAIIGSIFLFANAFSPNQEDTESDHYDDPLILPIKLLGGVSLAAGGIIGIAAVYNSTAKLLPSLCFFREKLNQDARKFAAQASDNNARPLLATIPEEQEGRRFQYPW
ncbi:MAG: hypothetical protein SFW66_05350 [Gammaproteobacteria bacterium]|nr:hypothetical protein [Gammaproteobacteria bacterium]